MLSAYFISLHIRSMSETICDAPASFCAINCGPNLTVSLFKMLVQRTIPSPEMEKCQGCWFRVSPHPPQKWKVADLGTLSFSTLKYPPWQPSPPLEIKSWQIWALWVWVSLLQSVPPSPPPPMKSWQIWAIWVSVLQRIPCYFPSTPPPSPRN